MKAFENKRQTLENELKKVDEHLSNEVLLILGKL